MDTLVSQLTVSALVGLVMGLTVGCTLIILALKTLWELVVDAIVWTTMPWAADKDAALEAAEKALAEA